MGEFAQQIIIGATILVALLYLLTRSRKKSCGSGCCPVKKPNLTKPDEPPK